MGGCAHQEDVIILDRRLAVVEALGKKLTKKTSSLEQKTLDLEKRDQNSGQEIEQNRSLLNSKIAELDKSRSDEDLKLRTQYASINASLEELKDEIQLLRGRLEETEFIIQQQKNAVEDADKKHQIKLDKISISINQIETRLQYIEQYLNFESASSRQPKTKSAATEEKTLSDQELYISAKQAFDQEDFQAARAGFEKIIRDFPKSNHTDNAQFWIGEIYYREKWYEKAILEYQKVIENYPKGNKVPASLLKQGFAFLSLGDKANARLILNELAKKHPETNEGKIATQKLKEIQ
jgi:tol-pal system protein YbgF